MHIELQCPNCDCSFPMPADALAGVPTHRSAFAEPWWALGDGETIEDFLHSALADGQGIRCPACAEGFSVGEECLGRMAMAMLTQW